MLGLALQMMPAATLFPLWLAAPGFTETTTDQIALLRHSSVDTKQRAELVVGVLFNGGPSSGGPNGGSGNGKPGPIGGPGSPPPPTFLPGPFGEDPSFFRYAGAHPVRVAFSADLDGDLTDEVVVIRESVDQDGRYLLSVHRTPSGSQNVSHPIQKTAQDAIGPLPAFGAIVAADGIDIDGDMRDEIMVVRQVASGAQRLEIYSLPKVGGNSKKSKNAPISKAQLGGPIASYLDLGSDPTDTIVDVAAVDMDGDAKEEIAVLRRAFDGKQTISVIPAPKVVADLAPVVFATLAIPSDSKPVLELDATDLDYDGIDELVVRTHFIASFSDLLGFPGVSNEGDRLDILPLPTGGTVTPLTILIPSQPNSFSPVFELDELVMLRGPNPKPGVVSQPYEVLLNDTFHGKLVHEVVSGDYVGGSNVVTVGPMTGATGKFDGTRFTLDIPGASTSIGGAIDKTTGVVDLSESDPDASVAIDLSVEGSSSTLHLVFSDLHVASYGSIAVLQGSYSGFVENSEGKKKPIDGGQLSFTSD